MKSLLLIISLCLSTACVKVTNEEGKAQDPATASSPTSDREPYVIVPSKEPLHYEVRLLLSERTSVVERISQKDQSRQVLPLNFQEGYLVDSTALSDQKYVYRLGRVDKGQYQMENEIQVQIPKDIVIQSHIHLSQDEVWSDSARLYLLPGGSITTNGYRLRVKTQKLFALGGVLRTYASAEGVGPGGTKDGGSIEIQAEEGLGLFRIELRGKNGKAGVTNFVTKNGTDGEAGGHSGSAKLILSKSSEIRYEPLVKPGSGGAGGAPAPLHDSLIIIPTPPSFLGTPGRPGAPGVAGTFCADNAGVRYCQ